MLSREILLKLLHAGCVRAGADASLMPSALYLILSLILCTPLVGMNATLEGLPPSAAICGRRPYILHYSDI